MNIFKKIVFVATLLIVVSNISSAQELGIRGGFNLSQINFKAGSTVVHKEDTKLNPGFNVGPILEFQLKNLFSIETGILFTSKGFKQSGYSRLIENYVYKINIFYSEVPVSLKVSYPIGKTEIFGMAGGYAACALYGYYFGSGYVNSVKETSKTDIRWGNSENTMKRLDYGLKFGAGLKIRNCQLGASYGLGLKDISNDETFKYRNRVLEFYVAYKIKSFTSKNNDYNHLK